MATIPLTVEQKLDEAKLAYHQLNTGTMARVVVDQSGQRVEFTAANKANLYQYIQDLSAQLGVGTSVPLNNGPARFVF